MSTSKNNWGPKRQKYEEYRFELQQKYDRNPDTSLKEMAEDGKVLKALAKEATEEWLAERKAKGTTDAE